MLPLALYFHILSLYTASQDFMLFWS